MTDRRTGEDDRGQHRDEQAARLRALFEERARTTPEAEIILNSGLIDNAVEEALHVMTADEPNWSQIGDVLRDGELDRAEAGLKAFFNGVSDSIDSCGTQDERDGLIYIAAQVCWSKAVFSATWSLEEAETWYEWAIELNPENFWLRVDLARFLLRRGAFTKAGLTIGALAEMVPDADTGVTALSELGEIAENAGAPEFALVFYRAAVGFLEFEAESENATALVHRDLIQAHREIAALEEEVGERAAAAESWIACLRAARHLMRMTRGAAPVHLLCASHFVDYALFLRRGEDWETAADAYEKAASVLLPAADENPRQLAIRALIDEGLGDVHQECGRRDDAVAAWRRARVFVQSSLHGMSDRPDTAAERGVAGERLAEIDAKLAAGNAP